MRKKDYKYSRKFKIPLLSRLGLTNDKVHVTTVRKQENVTIIKKVILTKEQISEQLEGSKTSLSNITKQIEQLEEQESMAKKDVSFFEKVKAKLSEVPVVQEGVG